jgi:hypothetical protein
MRAESPELDQRPERRVELAVAGGMHRLRRVQNPRQAGRKRDSVRAVRRVEARQFRTGVPVRHLRVDLGQRRLDGAARILAGGVAAAGDDGGPARAHRQPGELEGVRRELAGGQRGREEKDRSA